MTDKSITQLAPQLNPQWKILHNNYEDYEHYALIIKLVTVILSVIGITLAVNMMLILSIIAILWLQEGIWKTYQKRLTDVIIQLEKDCESNYPLYSQFQENRPNTKNLINEYISNALKPTVAFPYAPLMVIVLIFY